MGIREKIEAIKQKKKELTRQVSDIGTEWWGGPSEDERSLHEELSKNPRYNAELKASYQKLSQVDFTPFPNLRIAVKDLKLPETEEEADRMIGVLNQLESLIQKARKVLEIISIYEAVLQDTDDERSYFIGLKQICTGVGASGLKMAGDILALPLAESVSEMKSLDGVLESFLSDLENPSQENFKKFSEKSAYLGKGAWQVGGYPISVLGRYEADADKLAFYKAASELKNTINNDKYPETIRESATELLKEIRECARGSLVAAPYKTLTRVLTETNELITLTDAKAEWQDKEKLAVRMAPKLDSYEKTRQELLAANYRPLTRVAGVMAAITLILITLVIDFMAAFGGYQGDTATGEVARGTHKFFVGTKTAVAKMHALKEKLGKGGPRPEIEMHRIGSHAKPRKGV